MENKPLHLEPDGSVQSVQRTLAEGKQALEKIRAATRRAQEGDSMVVRDMKDMFPDAQDKSKAA